MQEIRLIDIHQLSTDHPLFKYNPEPERLSRLEIVKKKDFKVLGKFKSECSDPTKFLASVVMLRPKLYCLLSVTDDEKRRCKGISKEVVKNEMPFSSFESTFHDETTSYHSQLRHFQLNFQTPGINILPFSPIIIGEKLLEKLSVGKIFK